MTDATRDELTNGKRRDLLKVGAGIAATPLLGSMAFAAPRNASQGNDPSSTAIQSVRAFGATSTTSAMAPLSIRRRAVGPNDVLLETLYCGVCHSDIHTVRGEWGPVAYPSVPGHEIIGRVIAVGANVTKFRLGDIGGVGCMVDSCGVCAPCKADLEQYCEKGMVQTYGSADTALGGQTYGGYSERIVVKEHYVIRIPPGADLAATAPLLCAGITTFSPMQHWEVAPGQRIGVVGLGGLGHVAVQLAAARGARVTVITTSPSKVTDAKRLGAENVVLSTDPDAMKILAGTLDLVISTVPNAYDMQPVIEALTLNGTLVNVGAMEPLKDIQGLRLALGRRSLAGSVIGGIAETQDVVDYCAARNIKAHVEVIPPTDIDKAVRYRYVIDFASQKGKSASQVSNA
jgi:alcohol dehydrogenase (NADP+)